MIFWQNIFGKKKAVWQKLKCFDIDVVFCSLKNYIFTHPKYFDTFKPSSSLPPVPAGKVCQEGINSCSSHMLRNHCDCSASVICCCFTFTHNFQFCECNILAKQPRYMLKTNYLLAEKLSETSYFIFIIIIVVVGLFVSQDAHAHVFSFFSSVLYTNSGQANWAGGVQPNCLSRPLQIAGGQNSDHCS